MNQRAVSVIIPARDATFLPRTLASLAQQNEADLLAEVIVVSDGECKIPGAPFPVRLIRTERPVTSPVARNIGIRAAQTDWLAFVDADCLVAPDWAGRLLATAEAGHPVVGGGVAFGPTPYWSQVHNVSMLHEFHVSCAAGMRPFLPTLNLLVDRCVVAQVGMMDETLRRAQDLEWTLRMHWAGVPLWFEPGAVVTHYPERHPGSLWRDYYETGQTSRRVRARYAIDKLPNWFNSPILAHALAPLLAAGLTARIYARLPTLLRYLPTAPGVWFTKLAWCLGAASAAGSLDGESRIVRVTPRVK